MSEGESKIEGKKKEILQKLIENLKKNSEIMGASFFFCSTTVKPTKKLFKTLD